MTQYDIWYDTIHRTIRYMIIWYDIWYDTIYDMIHRTIRYMIIWYDIWYDTIYDTIRYMIRYIKWYNKIYDIYNFFLGLIMWCMPVTIKEGKTMANEKWKTKNMKYMKIWCTELCLDESQPPLRTPRSCSLYFFSDNYWKARCYI